MNKVRKNKKQITIITLILSIISLVLLTTIAYSAFSSTMNITGMAHARVEANVRITDFQISETLNATSSYEEFGKNHISTSINFKDNASATYKLEITNYGETNIGIDNITGIPTNVSYELIDYKLKDKICDMSGKCNNFAKKTFYIKFFGNNIDTNFTLNFEFKVFHDFTYIDFNNHYLSGAIDNDSLTIDLSKDSPKMVSIVSEKNIDYTYINNILTLSNVTSNLEIYAVNNIENNFNYTGSYQTFNVPYDGMYKVELWGGQGGGDSEYPGGKGGYTSGIIPLKKNTKLYVYVGSSGNFETQVFNNGNVSYYEDNVYGTGWLHAGGGATDVRLEAGIWNEFNSLKSRIMVAASGGGNITYFSPVAGGDAGGLSGYSGSIGGPGNDIIVSTGGTQTIGGTNGSGDNSGNFIVKASFGTPYITTSLYPGGGSGYYGGGSGGHGTGVVGSGAGGSSFISGHNGCDAITQESTQKNIIHTGQSIHYSNYKFYDTKMIDGQGYNWIIEKQEYTGMPSHDGTSTMIGNEGDGYAKITLINTEITYPIKYTNITGNYQTSIKNGRNLIVDFGSNAPQNITVLLNEKQTTNYTYTNGKLTINNVTTDIEIIGMNPYEFNYVSKEQTFEVPLTGIYKVELWGSSGQIDRTIHEETVGKGAYTSGNIELKRNQKLYLYIGGPHDSFNGGGLGESSGGGATDIRLINGSWDNFESLKSRIMVAGAGGGGLIKTDYEGDSPGDAGGLIAYDAYYNPMQALTSGHVPAGYGYSGYGGTQTLGGAPGKASNFYELDEKTYGRFGIGGYAYAVAKNSDVADYKASGGGSGYYGGGHGVHPGAAWPGGGGGSSFISGHNGCDAVAETSTQENIIHTGQSIHYSGYKFANTKMIDGRGYNWTTEKGTEVVGMPTFDGTGTMIGNTSAGYAKITLIEVN